MMIGLDNLREGSAYTSVLVYAQVLHFQRFNYLADNPAVYLHVTLAYYATRKNSRSSYATLFVPYYI